LIEMVWGSSSAALIKCSTLESKLSYGDARARRLPGSPKKLRASLPSLASVAANPEREAVGFSSR
jgi:hypothetical protein